MDFILQDNFGKAIAVIEYNTKRDTQDQFDRLLEYYQRIISLSSQKNSELQLIRQLKQFWNEESNLEIRIYRKMKAWEERHPILGIIVCAVLGGILVSMLTEIILEAILPFAV